MGGALQTVRSLGWHRLTVDPIPEVLSRGNTRFAELEAKAANAFPPAFGPAPSSLVESDEGRRAVELGRRAMQNAGGPHPSRSDFEREFGGLEGFFILFGCHYCRMFEDPRMNVLFDSRHADTNVSAKEHGKRVSSALLDRWFGTNYFMSLGRGNSFMAVTPSHQRAKGCPMRPQHHRAARLFTVTQRNAWLGHVCCAAEEAGASPEFQQKLGGWLAANISIYAPFLQEQERSFM